MYEHTTQITMSTIQCVIAPPNRSRQGNTPEHPTAFSVHNVQLADHVAELFSVRTLGIHLVYPE